MPAEAFAEPRADCGRCPNLSLHRASNRAREPGWHNAPVASWGSLDAALLVVGLAPGLRGANRTGRPFTGDDSGRLLIQTLAAHGFARECDVSDGPLLHDCRITNAVRCWPPGNRPSLPEVKSCNAFLRAELASMPRLRIVLALGVLAHAATLRALGLKPNALPFRHGTMHAIAHGLILADSYHVSRLNTNTGRLTPEGFSTVVAWIATALGGRSERLQVAAASL